MWVMHPYLTVIAVYVIVFVQRYHPHRLIRTLKYKGDNPHLYLKISRGFMIWEILVNNFSERSDCVTKIKADSFKPFSGTKTDRHYNCLWQINRAPSTESSKTMIAADKTDLEVTYNSITWLRKLEDKWIYLQFNFLPSFINGIRSS
mgnify:CR=1 FL=1